MQVNVKTNERASGGFCVVEGVWMCLIFINCEKRRETALDRKFIIYA